MKCSCRANGVKSDELLKFKKNPSSAPPNIKRKQFGTWGLIYQLTGVCNDRPGIGKIYTKSQGKSNEFNLIWVSYFAGENHGKSDIYIIST